MRKKDTRSRTSRRLQGYDYGGTGGYFITICTKNRERFFGSIMNGTITLTEIGEIVKEEWEKTSQIWEEVIFDEWTIMPNHFHALLWITNEGILQIPNHKNLPNTPGHKTGFGSPSNNLSSLIRGFKGSVTRIARDHGYPEFGWQRSFYDRIVRNENEAENIRRYIQNNMINWEEDELLA